MSDMNERIRSARRRTVVETDVEEEVDEPQPSFGTGHGSPFMLGQRRATTNDRLRSMFVNRPRAGA